MSDKKAKSGQLVSSTSEQARRLRAERRVSYGNKLSDMNLNRMRNRQSASMINPIVPVTYPEPFTRKPVFVAGILSASKTESKPSQLAASMSTTEEAEPSEAEVLMPLPLPEDPPELPDPAELMPSASVSMSLRRIASSYAHVCESKMGGPEDLPNEENEEDAREERAEVLIKSEVMPPPSASPPTLSSANQSNSLTPAFIPSSLWSPSLHLSKPSKEEEEICDPIVETRATERWHHLGNTVSALFKTRRCSDSQESPMARLRRVREQRDLLEAFTRPFLYEAMKRE